jgi:membrane protease YdiL (CAAX protease family)
VRAEGDLPSAVKVVGWVGAILFWVVQLTLLFVFYMALPDTILLAALLVAVPAVATAQLPLIASVRVERLSAYWGSIATLWLLGSACWLVGTRRGGAAALGLFGLAPVSMALWSVGLTVGGLLTILLFREISVRTGAEDSPVLRELMPRTRQEKGVFGLLSLAAGVAEELAYRGYAIPMLAPLLGVGGAAILTSTVFGVLHGYQGWLGTVRTGLMGGLLAWGFLASGSLWPPIVAHTAIDLIAGIVLGEKLLPPPRGAGVEGALDARSPETER